MRLRSRSPWIAAHGGVKLVDQRAHGIIRDLADMGEPSLQFFLRQVIGQPRAVQRIDGALDDFLEPAEIRHALPQRRREIRRQGVMRLGRRAYSRHSFSTQLTGRR